MVPAAIYVAYLSFQDGYTLSPLWLHPLWQRATPSGRKGVALAIAVVWVDYQPFPVRSFLSAAMMYFPFAITVLHRVLPITLNT